MLEQAFSFSAEELELNRSGEFSSVQEDRLKQFREVRGCGRKAALIAFSVSALALFIVPIIFARESGMAQARPYIWSVAGFFLAIILIFGILDIFAGQNLTQGKMSTVEGGVETWKQEIGAKSSKVGTTYFMRIGHKKFQLMTEEQMNALEDDKDYRFYYVENGRVPIILSVEELD